ncbi:T9SS type A sorting domain-containing protein [candidate division WOR-3 bacterium]|nr:T9SS type A sorting domain-containing protein [candidate division WOR-3 bacterium]MCK4528062.1 T9SS type A sorting domain-containing protein [candidate division WOR-3 bacterium]
MLLILISISITTNLHLRTDRFKSLEFFELLYITTDGGGLLSFNPEDSLWKNRTTLSGLFSNNTKDIYIRDDSIWVLSPGGITIYDSALTAINTIDFNPLFFNDTIPNTIVLKDSLLILGGETGLQWLKIRDIDNITRVDHIEYNFSVFTIFPQDTCYLLGTSDGVYWTTDFSDTLLIESQSNTYTLNLIDNSIWAGGSWGCKNITDDTAFFSGYTVWQILEIDEKVHIATTGGLYEYNGIWERIGTGDVRGVCKVEGYDSPLFVVRGEGLKTLTASDYLRAPGLASNKSCDLTQTPDGKIYLTHRDTRRISTFNGEKWEVLNRNNEFGFPGGILFNIESDSKGIIYFGFWYFYEDAPIVYQWNPEEDSIPEPIDLPVVATTVTGMIVDKSDDLWVGALRVKDNWVFRMHRVSDALTTDSLIWKIYSSPSIRWPRVFAEGEEGVYTGNSPTMGGAGIHLLYPEGTIDDVVGDLGSSTLSMSADIEGDVWAGLEDKLVHISGKEVKEIFNTGNSGLLSNKMDGLAFDFQGGMWCYHSGEGLSYRSPTGNWTTFQGFSYAEEDDITYPLHFSRGHCLFIGTYEGLYEIDIDFNIPQSTDGYAETNVYPNPFNAVQNKYLYFSSEDLAGKRIYIYDIYGRLKDEFSVSEDYLRMEVDLPSGLYFYVVKGEGGIVDKGRFVVVR